jgi:ribose transport system permease protein
MIVFGRLVQPNFGTFDLESLALATLPLALAALAQSCVVISGGIDLSLGSLIAVANVLAARLMKDASIEQSLAIGGFVLMVATLAGAINGLVIVFSRIPDVMVTLTTGFIFGGVALLILKQPGGGAPSEILQLAMGGQFGGWLPNSFLILIGCVLLVWLPLRRSRLGLALFAIGSDQTAAFRSGVDVPRARVSAYALSGLFAGLAGLALVLTTGIGSPLGGAFYTLTSVAAITLGGVSLAGGQGNATGPILASLVLSIIPMILIFLNIDPNYGQVLQGGILVVVVMIGGALSAKRSGL